MARRSATKTDRSADGADAHSPDSSAAPRSLTVESLTVGGTEGMPGVTIFPDRIEILGPGGPTAISFADLLKAVRSLAPRPQGGA